MINIPANAIFTPKVQNSNYEFLNLKTALISSIGISALCYALNASSAVKTLSTVISTGLSALYLARSITVQKETTKNKQRLNKFIEARPLEVKESINHAFTKLQALSKGTWTYNGDSNSYRLLRLNECNIIKKIIEKAPIEKKDFCIIDLGAGDFKVAETIANFIKKNPSLLRFDQKIHIISVRGEQNKDATIIEEGNVIRYNLGGFEIENLSKAFQDLGFSLENNTDLILSAWTFRHLVDPVGTLAQTYNLLKENGILLMDGFFILNKDDTKLDSHKANCKLKQMLSKLGVPIFLKYIPNETGDLTQFALKKPNLSPFPLEMQYHSKPLKIEAKDNNLTAAPFIASFEEELEEDSLPYLGPDTLELHEHSGFYPMHYGDKSLADELTEQSKNFNLTLQHYRVHAEILSGAPI